MKKLMSILLCCVMLLSCVSFASAEAAVDTQIASSVYGWVTTNATMDENNTVTVEIMEVPSFEKKVYTSAVALDDTNELTGANRAQALVAVLKVETFIEVMLNAAGEVVDFELVEQNYGRSGAYNYYFDSARFGGELTAANGGPGSMVAQGWILDADSDARTITIGDGNRVVHLFEEKYELADDAEIYLVDNSYTVEGVGIKGTWNGIPATMKDIKICPVGADGEIYYEREKYTALCIFDGDYTQYGTAKVSELYLFRNPLILADDSLITPDSVAYDGCSWYPTISSALETHAFGFDGSCEPFEVMANRLYSIGDSYTCMYLMIGDDGSMTILDQGNTCAIYQYYLNIEKMGFDPREVDNIILTHGHGDHYQALYENNAMINRYHVGKGNIDRHEQYISVATSAQNDTGFDYLGYAELTPNLSDNSVRYLLTEWDVWYEWRSDLGGGIEVYPFLTIGHSKDTASFAFKFVAREEDQVFEAGETIGFIYMGGYGAKNNLSGGYDRLAYVDGLRSIQSIIAPQVAAEVDYIYNMPQHSNQYPWYDVYKASKIAGVHFMSVLTEGLDCVQNFCEKRISYNTYDEFYDAWASETDAMGNMLEEKAGFRCLISSRTLQTIESYGPYKRAAGDYELTVESASILHGFDPWQNAHEAFAGQTNVYGFDLAQGFLIHKDSFVEDPNSYFVQIVCKVNDDYAGKVDYETNFYGAENYARQWTSGPVEIANRKDPSDWTEIVRTKRVDSLEEAEALLAAIEPGKTYQVSMDLISEILLAETPAETFVPVK